MTKIQNTKPIYDLEERTFQFTKQVRLLAIVKNQNKNIDQVIVILNLEFICNLNFVI